MTDETIRNVERDEIDFWFSDESERSLVNLQGVTCPFCKLINNVFLEFRNVVSGEKYSFTCFSCHASSSSFRTQKEARDQWLSISVTQQRTDDAPPKGVELISERGPTDKEVQYGKSLSLELLRDELAAETDYLLKEYIEAREKMKNLWGRYKKALSDYNHVLYDLENLGIDNDEEIV